jgi:hypothetical protein
VNLYHGHKYERRAVSPPARTGSTLVADPTNADAILHSIVHNAPPGQVLKLPRFRGHPTF